MKKFQYRFSLLIVFATAVFNQGHSQRALPDELLNNTIEGQIRYLEERTRIYEDYRAIREDMFQKVNSNVLDSLAAYKNGIAELNSRISALDRTNASLVNSLEETKTSLEEVTRTKNAISLFGMEVNKVVYNSVMMVIIAALLVLLVMGYMVFRRNMHVTARTREEIDALKNEFEEYRQSSQRAREKMTMEHFKEIQKLKEK